MCKIIYNLAILGFLSASILCYEVPPAKLEAIYPKGLRVTVPGMDYKNLFIFLSC